VESVLQQGEHQALQDAILVDLYHAAKTSSEYYGKITASLGPVFDKINKTSAGDIFSWTADNQLPVIELESLMKEKKIVYMGLDAMSNKAMCEGVGQAIIADLISLCGRLYKEEVAQCLDLCLHVDEVNEIVRDEFVTLLNKAGGAGVKVTAYTQTVNDLGAAFSGNSHKSKMMLGNFGTVVMMRIANLDTARIFTECLEVVRARTQLPTTLLQDRSYPDGGEYFSTSNTDIVQEDKVSLVTENDLFSLPKGQALVLTDGGELYKIRIPLPGHDENEQRGIAMIMQEVNRCEA